MFNVLWKSYDDRRVGWEKLECQESFHHFECRHNVSWESQGRGSLVGCRLWGRTDWSDLAAACFLDQGLRAKGRCVASGMYKVYPIFQGNFHMKSGLGRTILWTEKHVSRARWMPPGTWTCGQVLEWWGRERANNPRVYSCFFL